MYTCYTVCIDLISLFFQNHIIFLFDTDTQIPGTIPVNRGKIRTKFNIIRQQHHQPDSYLDLTDAAT